MNFYRHCTKQFICLFIYINRCLRARVARDLSPYTTWTLCTPSQKTASVKTVYIKLITVGQMLGDYSVFTANTYSYNTIYIHHTGQPKKKTIVEKWNILQCLNILPDSRHSGAQPLSQKRLQFVCHRSTNDFIGGKKNKTISINTSRIRVRRRVRAYHTWRCLARLRSWNQLTHSLLYTYTVVLYILISIAYDDKTCTLNTQCYFF